MSAHNCRVGNIISNVERESKEDMEIFLKNAEDSIHTDFVEALD